MYDAAEKMRARIIAILGTVAVFAPACRGGDCELSATCAVAGAASNSNDGGPTGDGGDGGAAGYPLVDPPAGCVADADPKTAPACVDNLYALFVDPTSGNDVNPGTRESPLHSLKSATEIDRLHGRPRIYLCAGTTSIDEPVDLPPNVSLIGGFKCGTWEYVGAPFPIIAPSAPSLAALHVFPATTLAITISDIEIRGAKGNNEFPSSVGLFISHTKTALRRVTITAGETARPLDWSGLPTNGVAGSLDGNTATASIAAAKTCKCPVFGSSIGGAGGDLSAPGGQGVSEPANTPSAGGVISATCTGGNGVNGAAAGVGGGIPSGAPGHIDPDRGWLGADGANGTAGTPGVGGGGGAGSSTTRGGGGACGGCGGNGGRGGRAGGSSIAIVAYDSELAVFESSFTAKAGSNGASGEHGESGFAGGSAGKASGGICNGGNGGPGAGGGGGTGGTSGISAAIVRFKGAYSPDGQTKLAKDVNGIGGIAGGGGDGGKSSGGDAPNATDGQAGAILLDAKDMWELTE